MTAKHFSSKATNERKQERHRQMLNTLAKLTGVWNTTVAWEECRGIEIRRRFISYQQVCEFLRELKKEQLIIQVEYPYVPDRANNWYIWADEPYPSNIA